MLAVSYSNGHFTWALLATPAAEIVEQLAGAIEAEIEELGGDELAEAEVAAAVAAAAMQKVSHCQQGVKLQGFANDCCRVLLQLRFNHSGQAYCLVDTI